jgi:hypothetical protein
MKDVRLERAPFFPFSDPISGSDHSTCPFTGNRLLDRTGKTFDPVRSAAYFPEWKLALNVDSLPMRV